ELERGGRRAAGHLGDVGLGQGLGVVVDDDLPPAVGLTVGGDSRRPVDMADARLRVHGLGGYVDGPVLDGVAPTGDGPVAVGLDVEQRTARAQLEEALSFVDDL